MGGQTSEWVGKLSAELTQLGGPSRGDPGPDTGGVCVSRVVGGGREECQNHAYIQELEKVVMSGGGGVGGREGPAFIMRVWYLDPAVTL